MSYSLVPIRRNDGGGFGLDEERVTLHNVSDTFDQNFHTAGGRKTNVHSPADWTYLVRFITFAVLEASFLALAGRTMHRPLIISSDLLDVKSLKGVFTVVSIVWHSLAILAIRPIAVQVISSEWYLAGQKTGQLAIGKGEIVSTVTASFMDHLRHPYRGKASIAYNLAMLLSLVLVALGGIGPGTLGVSTTLINITTTMDVADLGHLSDISAQLLDFVPPTVTQNAPSAGYWMDRAERIVRLEGIDGSKFRSVLPDSYIIPYAQPSSVHGQLSQGDLYYRTDVIHFNYTCGWQIPQGDPNNEIYATDYEPGDIVYHNVGVFDDSGTRWILQPGNNFFTKILLVPNDQINGSAGGVYQLFNGSTSRTAFLFISGSNGTSMPIDLSGIPTFSTETVIPSGPRMAVAQYFPTSAMLICDPRPEVIGGTLVRLQGNKADIVTKSGMAVGNVPQASLDFIFSTALLYAMTDLEASDPNMAINSIISTVFLTNRTYSEGTANLLPLEAISQNMNKVVLSATKAYSDGFGPLNDSSPYGTFSTTATESIVQLPRTVLITTRELFYATVSLVIFVPIIFMFLFSGWRTGKSYPFNLSSLATVKDIKLLKT